MNPVRIGVLGAARITPMALLAPARRVGCAEAVAIAARDRARAHRFAKRHGISRVHEDYDALVSDPDIEAVYVPLPNALHGEWTLRALDAHKHVLCEKPFAANASEAERVAAVAERSDRVVMEAFHWRYHPLAERMLQIVQSGELGRIEHVETAMCIPLLAPGNIRYRLDLAGGATMDVGCYAIHMLRTLAGAEPAVVDARARLASPGIDRFMCADLRFDDGRTGRITCSLLSTTLLDVHARVRGDRGELSVFNPVVPQLYHRLRIRTQGVRSERLPTTATYDHQLRAFCSAVRDGAPVLTPPSDAVANMRVIDAVYARAGLSPRKG